MIDFLDLWVQAWFYLNPDKRVKEVLELDLRHNIFQRKNKLKNIVVAMANCVTCRAGQYIDFLRYINIFSTEI